MTPSPVVLVVLGGWLGCQPRHLRPYERLYESMGYEVLSVIPSPLCVIGATLNDGESDDAHHPTAIEGGSSSPARIAPPQPGSNSVPTNPTTPASVEEAVAFSRQDNDGDKNDNDEIVTMRDLAWNVLREVHDRRADGFLYHSFSNGGCFLWESLSRILLGHGGGGDHRARRYRDRGANPPAPHLRQAVVQGLRDRCRGVVFDSCPAWFGPTASGGGGIGSIERALGHCSAADREMVRAVYGDRLRTADTEKRNRAYFRALAGSPLNLPQLYLYGADDKLASHEHITGMVRRRRSAQTRPVLAVRWERSRHCGHLRDHPDEYRAAVRSFLRRLGGGSPGNRGNSRL